MISNIVLFVRLTLNTILELSVSITAKYPQETDDVLSTNLYPITISESFVAVLYDRVS